MAFYRCTICLEDGTDIAADVMVSIEETIGAGAPRWHGTITIKHMTKLDAGQKYRIVLPDGRVGDFVVRRNTYAGGEDRAVAINGLSPFVPMER
ncbi:MAG TPA: hypothetical protein VGA22_09795 [Gemmatimonadales bacterium]|jgi:hypothetical protein